MTAISILSLFLLGIVVSGLILVQSAEAASKTFTFKITVWAVDASSDMGDMKVKVTLIDKNTNKGVTKSKTVDIGKTALRQDESDFPVVNFDFKGVEKGDGYIACIAKRCHDFETIVSSKRITEKISVGNW